MDVGGGRGATLAGILAACPGIRGILFDQAHVVAGAEDLLHAVGVSDRCAVVAGDFFRSVPAGGDVYLLKGVIHNWNDDSARAILANCRRAIAAHGKLLLVTAVLAAGNLCQRGKCLMDLPMLVIHGGAERTADELAALLASAGFRLARIIPTQTMVSVIQAEPV